MYLFDFYYHLYVTVYSFFEDARRVVGIVLTLLFNKQVVILYKQYFVAK